VAIETGDIIRVVANISLPDEVDAVNIWDWKRVDTLVPAPENGDVTAALASKLVAIYGEIENNMSDLVTVVSATNYKMGYELGQWVVSELLGVEAIGVQGNDVNEMLPHGVAGLITLPTTTSKTRGRKFFAGLSENATADGTWIAAAVTAMLAAAAEYAADISVVGEFIMRPVLLSTKGNVLTYNAYAANGTPSYQRRRKPGVGS